MNYYQPKINAETGIATQNNLEPSAYSYTEMGTNMSDDYSYLDQSSDEMAAKEMEEHDKCIVLCY